MEGSAFWLQVVFPIVVILLQVIIGIVLAVMGFFLKRYVKQQDEKNQEVDRRIEKLTDDLGGFKASLPHAYVLREDWIRNMTTFDYKLESVRKGIDALRRDSVDGLDSLRKYFIGAIEALRKDFKGGGGE